MRVSSPRQRGFTLIEVGVVIAIIAILTAVLFPAIQGAREPARRAQCTQNLRLLGIAMQGYVSVYGKYPAGVDYEAPAGTPTLWSWQMKLLPFMEEESLDAKLNYAAGITGSVNRPHLAAQILTLRCPSDEASKTIYSEQEEPFAANWSLTSYLGVAGPSGMLAIGGGGILSPAQCSKLGKDNKIVTNGGILFGGSSVRLADIKDGLNNTIVIGERGLPKSGERGWWTGPGLADACPAGWTDVLLTSSDNLGLSGLYRPSQSDADAFHWWSYHAGVANFAFADGSVRALPYELDQKILKSLSTRSGAEEISER